MDQRKRKRRDREFQFAKARRRREEEFTARETAYRLAGETRAAAHVMAINDDAMRKYYRYYDRENP